MKLDLEQDLKDDRLVTKISTKTRIDKSAGTPWNHVLHGLFSLYGRFDIMKVRAICFSNELSRVYELLIMIIAEFWIIPMINKGG